MKSFSLALGGGAARWLAHIGVIRYLEEQWETPQHISGTSMGAIIATFYALWYTSKEMTEIVETIRFHTLVDLDLKNGLIRWKNIMKFLWKFINGRNFSDTKIPLSIVATNIDTGEKIVFQEWSLLDAIRASISIPWLFSPHKYNGHTLVDGWLTENLPVEILPVQIPMNEKKKRQKKFTLFPEWTLFSNSYYILRKTIGIMIAQNEIRSRASRKDIIIIQPWHHEIDYYDFRQKYTMIEAWYSEAKKMLQW
jgi:predicted acylesterase/phospholipase RssA